MIKVDIFSGFLGAGKTTLIKKLIAEAYCGEKLVLIENEFGDIGIDGEFLKESGVQINELNSGCICCSLVGDFSKALKQVVSDYSPERIIIEPSGVGKLSDVIKAVNNAECEELEINALVTVADAKKCKMYMKNFGEFYNDQIENAGCVVLSHTDTYDEVKLQNTVDLIKEHNSIAVITTTAWDKLSGEEILKAIERKDTIDEELIKLHEEEICPECGYVHHHHHHDGHCDCHEHEHHHDKHCDCHEHEHHHDEHCDCHEHEHRHGEHCGCHHHDHNHEHHHHADDIFTSCGIETAKSFTLNEMKDILNALQDEDKYGIVLRAKGIVSSCDDKWIHFDYVPGEPDVRCGHPAVCGRICVIGSKINEPEIKQLFKA